MSLNDPTRRPWGTAKGARRTIFFVWIGIALLSLAAVVCIVLALSGPIDFILAATILAVISALAGAASMHFDFATAQRRGAGDAVGVAHMLGAWISGAGGGMIVAAALLGQLVSLLSSLGLLILGVGVAIFFSPNVFERYRADSASLRDRILRTGVRTRAKVTEVRTTQSEYAVQYRVTMRFTDQEGHERWLTRSAPAGTPVISKGRMLPLHYDPQNPSRRRTIVVDWPTYGG